MEEGPPNAVLAFLEPGNQVPEDVGCRDRVIAVRGRPPFLLDRVLEGTVGTEAGTVTCSLTHGRPLSPLPVRRGTARPVARAETFLATTEVLCPSQRSPTQMGAEGHARRIEGALGGR